MSACWQWASSPGDLIICWVTCVQNCVLVWKRCPDAESTNYNSERPNHIHPVFGGLFTNKVFFWTFSSFVDLGTFWKLNPCSGPMWVSGVAVTGTGPAHALDTAGIWAQVFRCRYPGYQHKPVIMPTQTHSGQHWAYKWNQINDIMERNILRLHIIIL